MSFEILKDLHLHYMTWRRQAAILSAAVIAVFVISFVVRGFNLGLDFTGGTVIEVGYEKPAELAEVTAAMQEGGFGEATIQYFGSNRDVLIRLAPEDTADEAQETDAEEAHATLSNRVFEALSQAADGAVELRRVEFVGPQVGEELREQGGLAVLFSLIAILIYVALRFEWRFAIGAVAALAHDVLITVGFFSLLQIPFDLTVLAAVLAVIGYSLNDTIVIFDRVRENFRRVRKGTPIEIVDRSINETMSRTIITSGTTLFVVVSLYLLGGEAIGGFALALIIGVISGTYSTIYIATAIAIWLGISKADLMPPPKEGPEVDARP